MNFMYILPPPPSISSLPSQGVSQGPLLQVSQNVADRAAEGGTAVALSGQQFLIWICG